MLSRIVIKLDCEDINFMKAPNYQGVLMELIDPVYAAELHQQSVHPYSQSVVARDGEVCWIINALCDEAYEKIIVPISRSLEEIKLHDGTVIKAREKSIEIKPEDYLIHGFNEREAAKSYRIRFLTPTAFHQRGRYIILPDVRLLLQNLMMRYSAASENVSMVDDDTLNQLEDLVYVSRHRIASARFPMGGSYVPGFMGETVISCDGRDTMRRYVRMLLQFAEFSGVGIKTAIGMGMIQVEEVKRNDK